jgi:hypothetical protein
VCCSRCLAAFFPSYAKRFFDAGPPMRTSLPLDLVVRIRGFEGGANPVVRMSCGLPPYCKEVRFRHPWRKIGLRGAAEAAAYCPIFRFVRDAITQHNATP